MTEKKKLSTSYKLLCALGFHYSEEEYGQASLWGKSSVPSAGKKG